ncbi:hypothetical protein E2C01_070335 [Portunus trituberculatus]|uniref:Uncharacterized protein n=1 Tax=Portunus trituberculatus TaxID=210409 RepID=A0A5B7I1B3_PORTR|nr:hypothetical protein [Portunus trituberculatus]
MGGPDAAFHHSGNLVLLCFGFIVNLITQCVRVPFFSNIVVNRGRVESCVLWGPRGLQVHGFESCPRSECRLGFLTRGNGFLVGGL